MQKKIQQALRFLIPLSLFFSPFLIFSLDCEPITAALIIRRYLVVFTTMLIWTAFLFAVKTFISYAQEEQRKKLKSIGLTIILIIGAALSLVSLNYLKQSVSALLFYSVLATISLQSLGSGMTIRGRPQIALCMRMLCCCGISFVAFIIFEEKIIWQRLFIPFAFSIQAISSEIAITKSLPIEANTSFQAKLLLALFCTSLFIGPLSIGLSSMAGLLSSKYVLIYFVLLFSARIASQVLSHVQELGKGLFWRPVAALYALFYACMLLLQLA